MDQLETQQYVVFTHLSGMKAPSGEQKGVLFRILKVEGTKIANHSGCSVLLSGQRSGWFCLAHRRSLNS